METNSTSVFTWKNTIKVFLIILIVFALSLLVVAVYTPFYGLKKFNTTYYDSLKYSDDEKLALANIEFFEIKKHEAYLKARLQAAKSDSITLTINIPDSIISIDVQGFVLHQVKFKKAKVDFLLKRANRESVINYIENPLMVNEDYSTIKKEPVTYKKAPKDTIEAAQQTSVPDTIDHKRVMVKYYLDKDIVINMVQSERKPNKGNLRFSLNEKSKKMIYLTNSIFHLKIPDYKPTIEIELPKNDIKSFYRALPRHALVTIKI